MTATAAAPAAKPKREQLLTEREARIELHLRRFYRWIGDAYLIRWTVFTNAIARSELGRRMTRTANRLERHARRELRKVNNDQA